MKRNIYLILFVLLFIVVMPVAAQGDDPVEVMPLRPAVELILSAVVAALGGYVTSPIVTLLTGLSKYPLPQLNPRLVSLVISAVLTVLFWVASAVGWEIRLQSILDALVVAIPAFMTLIGNLTGSARAYDVARSQGVPVLGYSPHGSTPHKSPQG